MSESVDDELRTRLARIDPAGPDVPVDPATSPRAAELMERTMQTSADVAPDVDLPRSRPGRRPAVWVAGVAAVAAVAAAVFVVGGGSPVPNRPPGGNDPTTLALSVPAGQAPPRCRAFDVAVLRTMQVAFEGTVTATDGEQTTLTVDRWFTGGDADRVTIDVPDGRTSESLGIEFRPGARYLVTATDGTVNGCGYSGPATAELESAFADAFPRR